MTDEQVDRLLRTADPYDPETVRDLRGADQALMEEIMTATPDTKNHLGRRREWRWPLAGALVAAAVLAVAVSVPALRSDPKPSPGNNGQVVQAGEQADTIAYSAAAVEVAKNNPRLLIDEPGWKATTVYGFAKDTGTINFAKGDREVEMNWYPAGSYGDYYEDRLEVSKPVPATIAGQEGFYFRYSAHDLEAILPATGSTFVMVRSGPGFTDEDDVLAMFSKLKRVDVSIWLAALPTELVTPGKTAGIADEMLADVPLPPGFDKSALSELGINDRYQFGAQIIDRVECGWLREWKRADEEGDAAAERRSVKALKGARGWKVLTEMNRPDSGYVEGPWSLADEIAVGQDPMRYIERFNCYEQP